MEELARVYGRSLFEAAHEKGRLDVVREQLGQVADALNAQPRPARVLLLAVLLDRREAQALGRTLKEAEPLLW